MTGQAIEYPEAAYQTPVLPEVLTDGTLVYVANHPELRGCRAQADTPEHALENLTEVFAEYAGHFKERNLDMPAPKQQAVREVIWRSAATIIPGQLPIKSFSQPEISSGYTSLSIRG